MIFDQASPLPYKYIIRVGLFIQVRLACVKSFFFRFTCMPCSTTAIPIFFKKRKRSHCLIWPRPGDRRIAFIKEDGGGLHIIFCTCLLTCICMSQFVCVSWLGWLFDATQSYTVPLIVGGLTLVAASATLFIVDFRIWRQKKRERERRRKESVTCLMPPRTTDKERLQSASETKVEFLKCNKNVDSLLEQVTMITSLWFFLTSEFLRVSVLVDFFDLMDSSAVCEDDGCSFYSLSVSFML